MLKMLTVFLSFFMGRLNSGPHESLFSPDELIDKALIKLRGLMSTLAFGAVGTIFLTAGFLGAFYNLMLQLDTTGKMGPNAVVVGGIGLFVVGLILFGVAGRPQSSAKAKVQVQESAKHDHGRAISPLEEAISLLIMDHVKEREYSRESRRHRQSERSFHSERTSGAGETTTQASVH